MPSAPWGVLRAHIARCNNLLIRVDGREATSSCIMTSFVWPSGQQFIGEYEDSYKHETTWRFTSRVFTMLGQFSYAPA